MGKREINPVDAHRKKERKKELKKNKDEKKKVKEAAELQKEAMRLFEELDRLNQKEKEGIQLDKSAKTKQTAIKSRIEEINLIRRQAGLSILRAPSSVVKPKPKEQDDEELKWYHPTFNPHGPKKPKNYDASKKVGEEEDEEDEDESDEDESDDSDESEEEEAPVEPINLDDVLHLPMPEGPAPMESQFYHNLDLPEIRAKPLPTEIRTPHILPTAPSFPVPVLQPTYPIQPLYPGFTIQPTHPVQPVHRPVSAPTLQPANTSSPQATPQTNPVPVPIPVHALPAKPIVTQESPALSSTPLPTASIQKPVQPAAPTVISAAPKLRDLQKELTTLVPAALLKKRKAAADAVQPAKPVVHAAVRSGIGRLVVDAAPRIDDEEKGDGSETVVVNVKSKWVPTVGLDPIADKKKEEDDQYAAFMKELEDS